MPDCSRCQGQGEESYDEDGRMVTDVCYHCAGSGKVDEETDHHDRLFSVALSIGEGMESDYRKACNEEPDGDGYDLHAYENQMMPFDYFKCRVYDRAYEIAKQLSERSMEEQLLLIAWNELPPEPVCLIDEILKAPVAIQDACEKLVSATTDDIPF